MRKSLSGHTGAEFNSLWLLIKINTTDNKSEMEEEPKSILRSPNFRIDSGTYQCIRVRNGI